jgi:hypothetical protein
MMVVRKNVLEYIITLVVAKNKVRFVSRDKISHYFDHFICQKLYYDAEIA